MRGPTAGNPLVLLGVGILLATGAAGVIVDVSIAVFLAQSSLPILVAATLLAYGWYAREKLTDSSRRTIATWITYGVVSFFLVGFWFGFLSRRFDTSFVLAVVASLSIGAAFGALVGVYAARLQQANAELVAQKDRLEQFAGIVSHDLRSPLQVAQGRLNIAREDVDNEQLDEVATAHERMAALIDDLLTLARIDDGIETLEPVDLLDLADTSWHHVETANASLDIRTEQTIQADRGRVQQLLENLSRNAIEHGGEDVTVRVGELPDGFYVADDGAGIPADDLDQVFEAGFSTSVEGTGFGLNIVSEIVEAHGWSVRVTDSDDGGTRFNFTGVEVVDR